MQSNWIEAEDVDWLEAGVTAYKTTLDREDKLRAIYVDGERASMDKKKPVRHQVLLAVTV